MPSGKVHAIATTLTAGIVSPALVLLGGYAAADATAFAAGCMAGLLLTPDLDVRHATRSHALAQQAGGCLFGAVWSLWWYPYAHWLIPRHRHPLSHLPLLGTTIRVTYLLIIPLILWAMSGRVLPLPSPLFWWAFGGLCVVDAIHFILDVLF